MSSLHVIVSTPFRCVLDVLATEVEVDAQGTVLRFVPGCSPIFEAFSGASMLVRSADGAEAHVALGRGWLLAADGVVRVSAIAAAARLVRDRPGPSPVDAPNTRP